MGQQTSGVASELELLKAQVEDLERRLTLLERGEKRAPVELAAPSESIRIEVPHTGESARSSSTSILPFFGRAVLGMAGAYLLRAAAESEVVPRVAVVAAGLAYGGVWQFLSVRAGKSSRTAEAVYGIASALILFPLLWENTLAFRVLPAGMTALLLFATAASSIILARESTSATLPWSTTVVSSIAGLGLMVATRDPAPFAVALILTYGATELVACLGRRPNLRIVAAAAVDLAFCALLYLASQPGGFPAEYRAIPVFALVGVFALPLAAGASAASYRAIHQRRQLAWTDIWQVAVTFTLLLVLVVESGGSAVRRGFGLVCFVVSATCYFEVFFQKEPRQYARIFRFYANWGAALFLVGSYLLLPELIRTVWLCISAIAITALAARTRSLALSAHGFLWLMAAQISSGALAYAGHLVGGGYQTASPSMAWVPVLTAAACCFVLSRYVWEDDGIRALLFCSIANVTIFLGGFAVSGVAAVLPAGALASPPRLALLRTFLICAMTLVLALLGSRWNRREYVWAAYTAIGLGTVKLVLEDWRTGSTASFALSLLVLGALIAVIPRLVRGSRGKPDSP